MCDLTRKFLQLIYHFVDRVLEPRNLWILLGGMDEDLLAEVSIRDGGDDGADLSKHLLVGSVDLRIFLDLSLQLFYRLGVSKSV